MRRGTRAATVSTGLLALVLAGCSADVPPAETPMVESPADDDAVYGGTDDDAAMAADSSVMVASSSLGDVLVDGAGTTLYMFDPDAQGASTCYDECAINWPPLLLLTDEPIAGDGADQSLLGSVQRDDGGAQVTYAGWPLYYFIQDAAPGDVNGQGVNGVWWVLDAEGEPIR